jgi:hypothetical protein
MASLASEALDFGDRHAGDAHKGQGLPDGVERMRLDNRSYKDH